MICTYITTQYAKQYEIRKLTIRDNFIIAPIFENPQVITCSSDFEFPIGNFSTKDNSD